MRSAKRFLLIGLAGLMLLLVALSPVFSASPSGVGDDTLEYNCGGSCHNVIGSATITMWTSTATPASGGDVTVIVNVTGGKADSSGIIGVMLTSSLNQDASSIPTNAGWTIVRDPTGSGSTTYNYVEISNYAGTGSWRWDLKAPATADVYTLYARAMHGGGDAYYEDFSAGLVFDVGGSVVSGVPIVIISSVTPGQTLKGTVQVDVSVLSNKTIEYAVLRLGDTVVGNDTSAPFSFTLDSSQFTDGDYLLNVTAVDSDGGHGYKQIAVSVGNTAATKELISWIWTLVAGSIAIFAWIGIFIVIALMIRRKVVGGGGK